MTVAPVNASYLVVEEVHCVIVEFQRQRFQKGDIVGHDFLIREVKLVHNDGINVIIGQQII